MARCAGPLVLVLLVGCYGQPDIPADIYFSEDADQDEIAAIEYALGEWEATAGIDFFNLVGPTEAIFDEDNLYDNRHIIYLLRESTSLSLLVSNGYAGYGLHSDILIFIYNFPILRETDKPSYLIFLTNLVMHEAGHFLGLGHNTDDPDCLMRPTSMSRSHFEEISPREVEQVLFFY